MFVSPLVCGVLVVVAVVMAEGPLCVFSQSCGAHPTPVFVGFYRKARRALSGDIQRRVARKPWKEVKCSINLRALIYAIPTPQENDTVEAIVIDDD